MKACLLLALCILPASLVAQGPRAIADGGWAQDPPALSSLVAFARGQSELRVAVTRYLEDRAVIQRRYEVEYSPVRHERLRRFYQDWQRRLAELDFDGLSPEGRVDYVLMENRVRYQVAYMIGGLQYRALRDELVTSGRMTERQFHDAILQAGAMPVEMVRAQLTGQTLRRDYRAQWRFAGEPLLK